MCAITPDYSASISFIVAIICTYSKSPSRCC